MKDTIAWLTSVLGTIVVYLLGGLDVALQCLLIAIAIDYVTGIIKAYTTKTISSRIGAAGILKKLGILCLVALSVIIDRITGGTGAVRTLVIYYFVANEGLSVIENLGMAGLPVPTNLVNAFKALKKETEPNDSEELHN